MKSIILFFFLLLSINSFGTSPVKIQVSAGDYDRMDCPVHVDLSSADLELGNQNFQLYQVDGKNEIPLAFQIDHTQTPWLSFIIKGEFKKGEQRNYILKVVDNLKSQEGIKLEKSHNGLKLVSNGNPILNYQFSEVFPPEGVNPIYKRSGFIHPLWSPGGEVLTRIQAPDHYHHYGIWGPWTKTKIEGREVDFWNLIKGEGTVKFSGFLSEIEGPVFSGFSSLQEHIDFGAKGADQVAMNEVLNVNAWNTEKDGNWIVDYTSTLNCPLDSGILLEAYRYGGGIGFRATEKWEKDNSSVLTSEGNDRLAADGTKARWCLVEGESSVGRSGILFLSHPSNRAYPEPMRVWPIDANDGRGDMYFEFCPIRHDDWNIEKGKNYTLKYRMIIFDGKMDAEKAEQYWQAFANPPKVIIEN